MHYRVNLYNSTFQQLFYTEITIKLIHNLPFTLRAAIGYSGICYNVPSRYYLLIAVRTVLQIIGLRKRYESNN